MQNFWVPENQFASWRSEAISCERSGPGKGHGWHNYFFLINNSARGIQSLWWRPLLLGLAR